MPKWIADPGSYWMISFQARNSNPDLVRIRYDAAVDAAIAAINPVHDADWMLGAPFYGHGFHTVADLFVVPLEHIAQHTASSDLGTRGTARIRESTGSNFPYIWARSAARL